jgi:trigger factor
MPDRLFFCAIRDGLMASTDEGTFERRAAMAKDEVTESQVEEQNPSDSAEKKEEDPKEALKKAIVVEVVDAGMLRKVLTVTVPRSSLDAELDKDYKELVSEAIVPGFRRGRAPRRLVEKRFGNEIGEQVQTRVVPTAFLAATEKEDLKVLGEPRVWVKVKDKKAKPGEQAEEKEQLMDMTAALTHMKLPAEGDLTFKCEVEIRPEFELPSLEDVPVEKPDIKISDEDITVRIDRYRALRGNWAPVLDGEVEEDDLLICNMKMIVEGKEAKAEENIRLAARPTRLEGAVLEDFGAVVEGAKVGETRQIESELPDDHEIADLRGKKARFELTINEIKRLEMPPLEEAFYKNQGFDTEAEFRDHLKQVMQSELEVEIKRGMRNQVRKYLLEKVKLDLPEDLSARQTQRVALRRAVELQRQGVPVGEIEKHADELRTKAREQATAELKLYFILEEIAEKLEVEVTEEEINEQIAAMARAYNRRFDRVRDELAKNDGIESLYTEVRDEKCLDRILEKAAITEAKVEKKVGRRKSAKASEEGGGPKKAKPRRTPPKQSK